MKKLLTICTIITTLFISCNKDKEIEPCNMNTCSMDMNSSLIPDTIYDASIDRSIWAGQFLTVDGKPYKRYWLFNKDINVKAALTSYSNYDNVTYQFIIKRHTGLTSVVAFGMIKTPTYDGYQYEYTYSLDGIIEY